MGQVKGTPPLPMQSRCSISYVIKPFFQDKVCPIEGLKYERQNWFPVGFCSHGGPVTLKKTPNLGGIKSDGWLGKW